MKYTFKETIPLEERTLGDERYQQQDYRNWFNKCWIEAGGLISPASAAEYIGITRQSVSYLMHVEKIRKYVYSYIANSINDIESDWDKIFVSFHDTMKYAEEKYNNFDDEEERIPLTSITYKDENNSEL